MQALSLTHTRIHRDGDHSPSSQALSPPTLQLRRAEAITAAVGVVFFEIIDAKRTGKITPMSLLEGGTFFISTTFNV